MQPKFSIKERLFNELCPHPQYPEIRFDIRTPLTDWESFVHTRLVPEVRNENERFYGEKAPETEIEARYPGLDYCSIWHRRRLSQFPYHRRLFNAFDKFGLTQDEIYGVVTWEKSLHARRRHESLLGITVQDTTGDDISRHYVSEGVASLDLVAEQQNHTSNKGEVAGGELPSEDTSQGASRASLVVDVAINLQYVRDEAPLDQLIEANNREMRRAVEAVRRFYVLNGVIEEFRQGSTALAIRQALTRSFEDDDAVPEHPEWSPR